MATNAELKYTKEELRKLLIAVLDLYGGKIEVSYSRCMEARKRRVLIVPDDARQTYILTAEEGAQAQGV